MLLSPGGHALQCGARSVAGRHLSRVPRSPCRAYRRGMATTLPPPASLTYSNPVYDGYFADPAVIRTSRGDYWAYGTGHGPERDGRQFPVLHSPDLVHWE